MPVKGSVVVLEDAFAALAAARESAAHCHARGRGGVTARAYLRVVDTLCGFIDALRGIATLALADVAGNARKIDAHLSTPGATIWEMCIRELDAPGAEWVRAPHGTDGTVCTSVLWVQRALRFVVQVLRGVATGGSSMASVIAAAYDGTLGLHHGVLARGAFRLAALSAPSRADFLCCIVAIPGVIVGEAHLTGELMRVAYEANAFLADVDQFLVNEGVEEPWVI
jgi:hypothetical protein